MALRLLSHQPGQQELARREEFGDSAFKSRQDILAGESRVFAEQSAVVWPSIQKCDWLGRELADYYGTSSVQLPAVGRPTTTETV